jgi:peroxiredoxin
MVSLEEHFDRCTELNTVALGVGVDSVPCNLAWAKSLNIKRTELLSDFWPHGQVAKLYDVFREKDGFSERANILIDENQVVVFAKLYPISQLPDIEEIIKFLEA